jgi:hypothetical protein
LQTRAGTVTLLASFVLLVGGCYLLIKGEHSDNLTAA